MISIIIPVYNTAKWLPQCLDSVLEQDYRDIEVILVNDASTDNSLSLCRKYTDIDDRVVIVDKPRNEGIELARRTGFLHSQGDYIMYIDCDDWLNHSQVLSKMYKKAEETCADYVEIGVQRVIDRHKIIKQKCAMPLPMLIEQPELFDKYFLSFFGVNILSINIWSKLYRRSTLVEANVKPAGLYMSDDLAYNMQLFPYLKKIFILNEVGYNYRYGGITSRYNPLFLPDAKKLYLLKEEFIDKYQYYKARDWIRFELKNVLKTEICQRIAYGIDKDRETAVSAIMTEINDPIYAKLSEVDKSSAFWNEPFVKDLMAKNGAAIYEICRRHVVRDLPKRLLKRMGFGLLNLI